MKKNVWKKFMLMVGLSGLLMGCGTGSQIKEEETIAITEEVSGEKETAVKEETQEQEMSEEKDENAGLAELKDMLGMKDADTAGLLGGGEENWTEDQSFYIGRNYQTELYGIPCKVFTTCGEDRTVESVSVWIVSGEREVTEQEVEEWADRITEMMGVQPSEEGEVSEGGSKNRKWLADGVIASMNQMSDILTVSLQPAVGELE